MAQTVRVLSVTKKQRSDIFFIFYYFHNGFGFGQADSSEDAGFPLKEAMLATIIMLCFLR